MSTSKMMAQRFAVDLSSMSLGIWEAARLLSKKQTREKGQQKVEWLQKSLQSYKERSALSDSLKIYLNKEFQHEEFELLLKKLKSGDPIIIKEVMPEIEKLIEKTQEYLNESRRSKTDFQWAL